MRHRIGSAAGMGWVAAAAALALVAVSSAAQGPGGSGFGSPPPQMMAKFKAWQLWRDGHKNVTALQQTLIGLQGLERDPQTRLNKKQAGSVLAVLDRWRTQPAITDAQARQVVLQIKAPLNSVQLKTLSVLRPGPRGFGGPPPGGPGGPLPPGGRFGDGPPRGGFGGPPPPGVRRFGGPPPGGMNSASFPSPRDYNPLNPSSLPFKRQVPWATQRLADLKATLSRSK